MITKLLKIGGSSNMMTINMNGEYLRKHGFNIGDYVHVEVNEDRIVITKNKETKVVSIFSKKNETLDSLIDTFDLTLLKHG